MPRLKEACIITTVLPRTPLELIKSFELTWNTMLGSSDTGIAESHLYCAVSISCQCALHMQNV